MISFFGKCVVNLYKSMVYMITGRSRLSHVISQAAAISYDSLLISLVIAFVSAAVIAIQVSKQFLMSGAEAYVGGSIAIVMIREIAPGFVALAIGARAGTAISAEIANMQVSIPSGLIKNVELVVLLSRFYQKRLSLQKMLPKLCFNYDTKKVS